MISQFEQLRAALKSVVLVAIAGAGTVMSSAQVLQRGGGVSQASASIGLAFDADAPGTPAPGLLFSSSTESGADAPVAPAADFAHLDFAHLDFLDAMQAEQKHHFWLGRFRRSQTNQDGSKKYVFEGAAGFERPLGATHKTLLPSYAFQGGAGRRFSRKFAVLAQFDWDNFDVTDRTLSDQSAIYDPVGTYGVLDNLGGSSHVWSFTLNPTYSFFSHEGFGAFAVAGVGFYHKVTNFTFQGNGTYCDRIYGCYSYSDGQTIDHYTSNAPGFNAGVGMTYRPSHFSPESFFAEARYALVMNSYRPGYTVATQGAAPLNATNFFPANSDRATYIPVKFGVRF